jgi:hypothetical protein
MSKIIRMIFVFAAVTVLGGCAISASANSNQQSPERPDEQYYSTGSLDSSNTSTVTTELVTATPTPTPSTTPTPTPTPSQIDVTVSFAGDCTLGQNKGIENNSNSFNKVVGTDYAYPFKNAVDILSQDDLTLINLEGALTDATSARDKEFAFKGPMEYVDILTLGSVEAVNLANNHSYDYADAGLNDTKDTLDAAGILWSVGSSYAIYEVDGVQIGMAGFVFPYQLQPIYDAIDSLRDQGCDIVIISVHTGVERMYEPEGQAVNMAHDIIDYGADIYVGHHPHRLQPIEYYNGKYILYSLSNFTFGGQPNLTDPDTAIVQCTFSLSYETHEVVGNTLQVFPYSMTSDFPDNDYCPIPYSKDSEGYQRVMDKLNWTNQFVE